MIRRSYLEQNRALLKLLGSYIEKYPTMKFSQILANFSFVETAIVNQGAYWKGEFYAEPEFILKRVQTTQSLKDYVKEKMDRATEE